MNKHQIITENLSPTRRPQKLGESIYPFVDRFTQLGIKSSSNRRMSMGQESRERSKGLTKSIKSLRSSGKNETAGIPYVPLRDFASKKKTVFKGTVMGTQRIKTHIEGREEYQTDKFQRKNSFVEVDSTHKTEFQTEKQQLRRSSMVKKQLTQYDVENILADYEKERRAQNIQSFEGDLKFFKQHYETHRQVFEPKKKANLGDESDTVSTKMRKVRIKMTLSQRSDKKNNRSRASSALGRSFASRQSSGKSEKMYIGYTKRKDLWTLIASVICCDRSDYYLKWLVKKLTDDEEYQALRQPKDLNFNITDDRKKSNLKNGNDAALYRQPDSALKLIDYLMRQKQKKLSKSRDRSVSNRITQASLLPHLKSTALDKTSVIDNQECVQVQETVSELRNMARKRLQIFFKGVQNEIKKKVAVTPLNNREEQLMIQHARRNLARLQNITKNQFNQLTEARALRTSSKFNCSSKSPLRSHEEMAAFLVNLLGVDQYKPLRMVYSTKLLPMNEDAQKLQKNQLISQSQQQLLLSPKNLKHYVTHADLTRSPSLRMQSLRQKQDQEEQRQLPGLQVDLTPYKRENITTFQHTKSQAQLGAQGLPMVLMQTNIASQRTSSPSIQFEEVQLRPSQIDSNKGLQKRLSLADSEVMLDSQARSLKGIYYAKKQTKLSDQIDSRNKTNANSSTQRSLNFDRVHMSTNQIRSSDSIHSVIGAWAKRSQNRGDQETRSQMEHNIPITRTQVNKGLLTEMTMRNEVTDEGSVPRIQSSAKLAQSPTKVNLSPAIAQLKNNPKIKERSQQVEKVLEMSIVNDKSTWGVINLKNARKAQQMLTLQRKKVANLSSKDFHSVNSSSDTQFRPINTNSSAYGNDYTLKNRANMRPKIKMISSQQSLDLGNTVPKKHLFPATTQQKQILFTGRSIPNEELDADIEYLEYRNTNTLNQSIGSIQILKQAETAQTFKPFKTSAQNFASSNQNLIRQKQEHSMSPEQAPNPSAQQQVNLLKLKSADVSDSSDEGTQKVSELQLFKPEINNIGSRESIQKVYNRFRRLSLQQPKTMRPEIYKTEKLDTKCKQQLK